VSDAALPGARGEARCGAPTKEAELGEEKKGERIKDRGMRVREKGGRKKERGR
jgi:hypothetical protein